MTIILTKEEFCTKYGIPFKKVNYLFVHKERHQDLKRPLPVAINPERYRQPDLVSFWNASLDVVRGRKDFKDTKKKSKQEVTKTNLSGMERDLIKELRAVRQSIEALTRRLDPHEFKLEG